MFFMKNMKNIEKRVDFFNKRFFTRKFRCIIIYINTSLLLHVSKGSGLLEKANAKEYGTNDMWRFSSVVAVVRAR